jgi:hypothetical protein
LIWHGKFLHNDGRIVSCTLHQRAFYLSHPPVWLATYVRTRSMV